MALLLFVLFIGVPILELYVIIQVGAAIGILQTLALMVLTAVLGASLLRSQGRAAWQRFNAALAESRMPTREVFDGAMIILGGALLLTPGFITDSVGLVLLIPPTRDLVRGATTVAFWGRLGAGSRAASWGFRRVRDRRGAGPGPERATGGRPPGWRPGDIEGTAEEVREPEPGEEGGADEMRAPEEGQGGDEERPPNDSRRAGPELPR